MQEHKRVINNALLLKHGHEIMAETKRILVNDSMFSFSIIDDYTIIIHRYSNHL